MRQCRGGGAPDGGPDHQPAACPPLVDDGRPRHRIGRAQDDDIPLGREAGLTRYDESYDVATELHNVPLQALRGRRVRLAAAELRPLEQAIRIAHGLIETAR